MNIEKPNVPSAQFLHEDTRPLQSAMHANRFAKPVQVKASNEETK